MPIMTAGVHHACPTRPVGMLARFLDRKRIHIRPQTDDRARTRALQSGYKASAGKASDNFKAEGCKFFTQKGSSTVFLKSHFGVLVQMLAPSAVTRRIIGQKPPWIRLGHSFPPRLA
jgi:hypothetical protein